MRRSTRARRSSGNTRGRRLLAVVGTLAVFGGIVAVTQISSAEDRRSGNSRPAAGACVQPSAGATPPAGRDSTSRTWQDGRWVRNHWGDGQQCQPGTGGGSGSGGSAIACPDVAGELPEVPRRARAEVERNLGQLQAQVTQADRRLTAEGGRGEQFVRDSILRPLATQRRATLARITTAIDRFGPRPQNLARLAECQVAPVGDGGTDDGGGPGGPGTGAPSTGAPGSGLDVLANNCDESRLQAHDGFQNGNRCVSTAFGEVGAAANNPSLLITDFPQEIGPNQPFTLRVSTRNLVRDRFLPAGQGGYYVESSLLNEQGLVRGHFHTACRMLDSLDAPPAPQEVPAFFVATEDGGGGAEPDEVTIQVPGLPESGVAQCAVWAGDGSHRLPMMERANQTPAFDVVRIQVG
ncbi:hypothetical protein E1211_20220 [Micromonospora sp. 15K316]|uniref:hypothetical protein n=1 Tax=Micromonospora sp. 15K316 TaxID=2530376 RepID=UPI001046216E|nr:hypothetical protein [Micromonospora sp. 15K316]TDC32860.1 hypothetical protein E1211_20220 [Micromonospora sp. 15K316]